MDGRRINSKGIPARKIPACATCHGTGLGSREPAFPAYSACVPIT